MNDASRFERGERYSVVRDITTYRGVDPITGLDVLIYDFPGEARAAAGSIVSDHLPPILAVSSDGARGTLVSAMPFGASLVAPGERVVDDRFGMQAVGALRDAHALGLVHGDLSTSRVLLANAQVYLEGYGVPWAGAGAPTDEQALHADLQALVRALIELGGDNLSAEVSAALRGASAKGSYPPMTAPRLHAIIRRLAGGAVKVPGAGFGKLTLPTTTAPASGSAADAARERHSSQAATSTDRPRHSTGQNTGQKAGPTAPPNAASEDPEPITLNSDPGLTPPGEPPSSGGQPSRGLSPRDTSPGFVKALPPGATYRHGNLEEGLRPAPIRLDRDEEAAARRRSWRGPALLLLVLLVAGLAAYLTMLWQRSDNAGPAVKAFYLVDVLVEPANMPPVQMIVDKSPNDSTYATGTVLGSVPARRQFDAVGTWVVHGVFQERTTPPVTVQIPQTTSITLTFPPANGP